MTPTLSPQPLPEEVAQSSTSPSGDMPEDTPSVPPAKGANEPTMFLPAAAPSIEGDQQALDASNQPTVGLPVVQALPNDTKRLENPYSTMLLPSVPPELLRQEQGETGAASEPAKAAPNSDEPASGLRADNTPTMMPPSVGIDTDTPSTSRREEAQPEVPPVPPPPVLPPTIGQSAPAHTPPLGMEQLPATPPYGLGNQPPAAPPFATGTQPQAPAEGNQRRQLYWILGGIGCLLLILMVACLLFFIVVLGSSPISGLFEASTTATATVFATRTLQPTSVGANPTLGAPSTPAGSEATVLSDDFSDPSRSNLAEGDDKETTYAFENGAYAISVKVPRLLAWSTFDGSYSNAMAQVDATLVEGPATAAAALIFRYQNNSNFYVYNVAGDGRYNLEIMENNTLATLIDWTPSPAIKRQGETNVLRLEIQGERIVLYANDTKLEETSDSTFTGGQMSLAVNTFDEGGAKVVFDNLRVETE